MASPSIALREAPVAGARPLTSPLRAAVAAALVALVVLLPLAKTSITYDCIQAAVYGLVGLSMNVLVGYTGQLSLGQQGFVGLGALVAANVTASGNVASDPLRFALGLVAAAAAGALTALVLGFIALRITGLYLALVTLVFGSAISSSLFGVPALNGHDAGVKANRPPLLVGNGRFYLLCLALLAAAFVLDRRLTASKTGRAMLALRDNERAAQAFGINVVAYKLIAFALTGGLAGLAGALLAFLAQDFSQKDYTDVRGFNLALTFVVIAVVGGLGSRVGTVVAAAFFGLLNPLLAGLFGALGLANFYTGHQDYLPGLLGAVLLLQTVILNPGGLGQVLAPVGRWLAGGPWHATGDAAASMGGAVGDVRA